MESSVRRLSSNSCIPLPLIAMICSLDRSSYPQFLILKFRPLLSVWKRKNRHSIVRRRREDRWQPFRIVFTNTDTVSFHRRPISQTINRHHSLLHPHLHSAIIHQAKSLLSPPFALDGRRLRTTTTSLSIERPLPPSHKPASRRHEDEEGLRPDSLFPTPAVHL